MASSFFSMTSPTEFYHVIQIIMYMWFCDPILVTLAFLREKLSHTQFYNDLTKKTAFFEGWSWFKLNNQGLAVGADLKFYTSVAKKLKLKVRKFQGLISTFAEVTEEKLVSGAFLLPPILNRVKIKLLCFSYLDNKLTRDATIFWKPKD